MRFVRMLVAGTALASSAAFAVTDSASGDQPSSVPMPQERQSQENPWFSQGLENPWTGMEQPGTDSALREPNEAEPSTTLSELGAPQSEPAPLSSPQPSDTDSANPVPPDPTAAETYTPPMGLGTDTYRS